jgi:hypothetical protein
MRSGGGGAGLHANATQIAAVLRAHWGIENGLHTSATSPSPRTPHKSRTKLRPRIMASLRNLAITILRRAGYTNIAQGLRWAGYSFDHPLALLGLT